MQMASEPAQADFAMKALVMRRDPETKPLAVSVPEARRHWGNVGKTSFYAAVKKYRVELVRLGGRTLVPMAEIERVLTEAKIPVAQAANAAASRTEAAKALASKSVAARRAASPPQKR